VWRETACADEASSAHHHHHHHDVPACGILGWRDESGGSQLRGQGGALIGRGAGQRGGPAGCGCWYRGYPGLVVLSRSDGLMHRDSTLQRRQMLSRAPAVGSCAGIDCPPQHARLRDSAAKLLDLNRGVDHWLPLPTPRCSAAQEENGVPETPPVANGSHTLRKVDSAPC